MQVKIKLPKVEGPERKEEKETGVPKRGKLGRGTYCTYIQVREYCKKRGAPPRVHNACRVVGDRQRVRERGGHRNLPHTPPLLP